MVVPMYKWLLGMGLAAICALPGLPTFVSQCGHLWYGTETLHSRSMDVLHSSACVGADALTGCLSLSALSCGCMIQCVHFLCCDHIVPWCLGLRCCWMTLRLRVNMLGGCGMHWYGTVHASVIVQNVLILSFVFPMPVQV